ncbi:HAD family hydrolase [Aliamphritea hakodatensis]|uniref:HAD family hydrolase n=1 Tax=Aliamphritea hakodatensis TaxID=2895352 RepID=UPI0022FD9ACB|nr:HAD family hydrolase [Aliamphritea hakodatensis]
MTQYKGLLFDKDGTLIDFMASWLPLIHEASKKMAGGDEQTAAEMLAATGYDAEQDIILGGSVLAAASNREIAEHWAPFIKRPLDDALVDELNTIFQQGSTEHSVPVTDLGALFDLFRARGLKLGIATSDSEQGIHSSLGRFNVLDKLDFICGYDTGHGIKPGAGMVNGFCAETGLKPEEVIVVGDNLHDIEMARNAEAGMAIGVLTGTSSAQLLGEHADHVLNNINEIPALLDRLQ